MALGCRDALSAGQWLPNSEASSSSTLSPLAQPFTVVRTHPKFLPDVSERPHHDRFDRFVQPAPRSAPTVVYPPAATVGTDLGGGEGGSLTSGGSDWPVRRTLTSNLVQAEPFYPQYGFRGSGASKPPPAGVGFIERSDYDYLDKSGTHWNEPFDGDSVWEDGTGRRISSWMEPRGTEFSGKGRISDYGPAIPHGDGNDASLPHENIWHSSHIESYVVKDPETDLNWLDGSSMHLQTSMTASTNLSNTSVLSENLSANASVLQLNVPDVSESCGTLGASTPPYYSITKERGFHRGGQSDCYAAAAYCYPKISSPPLRKMNPFSSCTQQNGKLNAETSEPHQNNVCRRRVSVTIREPNTNLQVDGRKLCAGRSDNCNDTKQSCEFPTSSVKEYMSGSELKTDDLKKFSDIGPEVRKICLSVNGSTEVIDSSQNTVTLDQSNNAVDSPCWKGASASRYSPLFDSDSLQAACSTAQKPEDLELTSLAVNDTRRHVSECFEKQSTNLLLKEVKGGCPSKESCLPPSDRSIDSGPISTKPTYENGILSKSAATQSVLDSTCNMSDHVKGDIQSSSSSDVFKLESAEQKASEVKEISSTSYYNTHFLVRSIYDLSALLSSCYNSENMLKEIDYDVIRLAKYNLETCLARKFELQKGNFLYQQKHGYVGDANDPIEECKKILSQQYNAPGETCESNAYKRLWIEAEAALCSMKYELEVVRATVGLTGNMKKMERDFQGPLESGEGTIQMLKTSPSTKSRAPTMAHEALTSNNLGFGGNSASSSIMHHVTPESNKEDLETSVMARLNVLRSRDNIISEQQNKLQRLGASESSLSMNHTSSIFTDSQFTTGTRSFVELSESTNAKYSQPSGVLSNVRSPQDQRNLLSIVYANHGNQAGEACRTISEAQSHSKEYPLASGTENVIESYIPDNGLWRAQLTGKHSTGCSSDWEHVLKEEVTR